MVSEPRGGPQQDPLGGRALHLISSSLSGLGTQLSPSRAEPLTRPEVVCSLGQLRAGKMEDVADWTLTRPQSAWPPHTCGKDCARIPRGHHITRASSGEAAEEASRGWSAAASAASVIHGQAVISWLNRVSGGRKSAHIVPATATRFYIIISCFSVGYARAYGTRSPTANILRRFAAYLSACMAASRK